MKKRRLAFPHCLSAGESEPLATERLPVKVERTGTLEGVPGMTVGVVVVVHRMVGTAVVVHTTAVMRMSAGPVEEVHIATESARLVHTAIPFVEVLHMATVTAQVVHTHPETLSAPEETPSVAVLIKSLDQMPDPFVSTLRLQQEADNHVELARE